MKILHIFKTFYPDSVGGVESVIHELCIGMQCYGVESNVLHMTNSLGDFKSKDLGYYTQAVPKQFRLANIDMSFHLPSAYKQMMLKADCVHYHFPWPVMDVLHLAYSCKKPCIITYHADITKQKILNWFYAPIRNLFLNKVNAIVATSTEYNLVSPVLQKYANKVKVIPIGISDLNNFSVLTERLAYWKARIPFSRFFVFIGALRYYKGLHILFEALIGTNYPLIVVGDGSETETLKKMVIDLQLPNVIFIGRVSEEDKLAILSCAYAFVFPSHLRAEAFGVALLEAARAAKPMISTELGAGMSYINKHQITGLVVPPSDVHALRSAMKTLWEQEALASMYGQAARQRFLSLFTADSMCKAYIELYKGILQ